MSRVTVPGTGQPIRFGRMDGSPIELVHAADVIGVHVRRDGEHVVTELVLDEVPQRRRPSEVSTTRSRSRPRTCHTLHRRSGWTCGSLIKVIVVADAFDDEPGISDGQIEHESTLDLPTSAA